VEILRSFLSPGRQSEYYGGARPRFLRIADYSRRLLLRVFTLAVILIAVLVPIVKYLMANFEGREVTTGQAVIFIVQSLTTTGYGELLPFHSFPMVSLTILLMVSGVFIIFMIAGTLMATLIESMITPKAPTFTRLTGHVVFTAFNETVARTIRLIKQHNIPYVVACEDQAGAVELMRSGINGVCADPRLAEDLKRLNIAKARLVVALNDDTVNINVTLGISTTSDTPVLAVMENENRAELAYAAGAKHVVTVEETLGQQLVDWICADASPTRFLELIDVKVSPEVIEQLKPSIIHVGYDSEFSRLSIGEARLRTETGATVAAVWEEDGSIVTPSAETMIHESTLIVLGPHDNVDRLASLMGGPGPGGHVVLVGAGKVGQEAGKRLNDAGIKPCVIDIVERHLYFKGKLIVGDATKPQVLHQAKIEEADTLISTINNDSINIFTVLAGKQLNRDLNIIARVVHVDAVDRLHQAGANHVLAEPVLGFQLLQTAMVEMGLLPKLSNYVVREVGWQREPMEIGELTRLYKGKFKVVCVVRGKKAMGPTLDFLLKEKDRLVILGAPENIRQMAEAL
jgi:voltage-gated potassium channel